MNNDKLQGEWELLPCPFCGGQAETDSRRAYRNLATGKIGDGVAVYCLKCSVESMFCCEDMPEYSRDELLELLVENWNRRAALASDAEPVAYRVVEADGTPYSNWVDGKPHPEIVSHAEAKGRRIQYSFTTPPSAAQAVEAVALWGLIAAMKAARRTLDKENDSEDSAIQDTIWHSPTETLFDFMDAAIKKAEAFSPTEAAQPAIPEATKGHTFPPQEFGDLWTAGINLGRHGNAIECYRETEQEAEALRDKVLAAINQPAAQVERPQWRAVWDGDSLAMLQHSSGRIFRLQELKGEWVNADDNDELVAALVVNASANRDAKDARLLRGLIELCGHVADGSDTVVSLYQDDATRDWIVATGVQGRRKTLGWARGPKEAIDAAITSANREG